MEFNEVKQQLESIGIVTFEEFVKKSGCDKDYSHWYFNDHFVTYEYDYNKPSIKQQIYSESIKNKFKDFSIVTFEEDYKIFHYEGFSTYSHNIKQLILIEPENFEAIRTIVLKIKKNQIINKAIYNHVLKDNLFEALVNNDELNEFLEFNCDIHLSNKYEQERFIKDFLLQEFYDEKYSKCLTFIESLKFSLKEEKFQFEFTYNSEKIRKIKELFICFLIKNISYYEDRVVRNQKELTKVLISQIKKLIVDDIKINLD
jgi:hypothetical protein